MNFFEQQDRSRQTTRTLLGLFAASVLFTCICIYFAAMLSINNTSLKWTLFADRLNCTPIVPVSSTVHPRISAIDPLASIPLLPSPATADRDYQIKGGGRSSGGSRSSGISRFGSSPTHNSAPDRDRAYPNNHNYNTNRTNYYHSTHGGAVTSANPNCHLQSVWWDLRVFFWTLIGTTLLMGLPSWWKINQLKAGGAVIAAELGGHRILAETATPAEQQLLNIVEEIAIAATMAVPPVYLLADESGVNAFAAGFTVNDAVIGVTQGCLDLLDRDELQGVIAHEFSHILNGDMAMNIRLMGMLHGILCLHVTGRVLSYAGYGRDNPLGSFGVLLRIIGFSGFISGRLIQSAISRQREFLADASAVQFTRNPDGIANALAKIGGLNSQIESPYAETTSHMFFGPALNFSWLEGLFATHPPLEQRIQVVRGTGQKLGTKIVVNGSVVPTFNTIARIDSGSTRGFVTTGVANLEQNPDREQPAASPLGEYGVLAYIYALLLDRDLYPEQLDYLAQLEDPAIIEQIEQMRSAVEIIPPQQRLAALDRQVTKIRDTAHTSRLLKCAYGMVDMLPPENWHTAIVYLILTHRLAPTSGTSQDIYHSIEHVWTEVINILGTLARLTSERPQDVSYSFEASLLRLPTTNSVRAELPPELNWREFQTDLSKIAASTLKVKQATIAACMELLSTQRQLPPDGADLMRSIAILLDCPVPARLDRQTSNQRMGG
jgi:Zn-dependent protease with chaperone function